MSRRRWPRAFRQGGARLTPAASLRIPLSDRSYKWVNLRRLKSYFVVRKISTPADGARPRLSPPRPLADHEIDARARLQAPSGPRRQHDDLPRVLEDRELPGHPADAAVVADDPRLRPPQPEADDPRDHAGTRGGGGWGRGG